MITTSSDEKLATALRLGDDMAERLAAAELRTRRLEGAVGRAIGLARRGRTLEAVRALEEAIRRKR